MKKRLFLLTTLVIMMFACSSEAEVENVTDGGFLWEVENGDTTIYLQGLIHVGNDDFYPLNEEIEHAYESSDVVLPQIDLFNISDETDGPLMNELAINIEGRNLQDDLSADAYSKLEAIFHEHEVSMEATELYTPWFLETFVRQLALEESDYRGEDSPEMYFLERAMADGKEVRELETYEGRVESQASLSDELHIEALEYRVENFEEAEENLAEMVGYWQRGEVQAYREMLNDTLEYYDEYMEVMNEHRNIAMADKLLDILAEDSGQTYFAMLNSMHLVEEPSIVSLIEEAGYDVARVHY